LLELAENEKCKLIIAADWTKFLDEEDNKDKKLAPVLAENQWPFVKSSSEFVLVTTEPPNHDKTPKAMKARKIIENFKNNTEMEIKICQHLNT